MELLPCTSWIVERFLLLMHQPQEALLLQTSRLYPFSERGTVATPPWAGAPGSLATETSNMWKAVPVTLLGSDTICGFINRVSKEGGVVFQNFEY